MDDIQLLEQELDRHLPHHGQIRRLFHGRGGCFADLNDVVIDAYPPVVIIYLYAQRSSQWLQMVVQLLEQRLPRPLAAIVLQRRYITGAPLEVVWGVLPQRNQAEEDGLRYQLRFDSAQNIGFFPDMAVGRQLVRQRAQGKKVLNLFAYTCSLSVAALVGGAKHVVNLDMNRAALDIGRRNHQLNDLDLRSTSFLAMEFFKSHSKLRKLGPYDLVICDPPTSQGKSFNARQHWPKLLRRISPLVKPGGELLACMNGPVNPAQFLDALLAEHLPTATIIERLTPNDYRCGDNCFPDIDGRGETALRLLRFAE
ncbi:MAG: class I SAM-dependent methyltransferase [Thermodesulfobacteriota bacterium]|nr:class I SAM-dependent methyltransferase [Thermodesulfobacteriota bacterium]